MNAAIKKDVTYDLVRQRKRGRLTELLIQWIFLLLHLRSRS